MLKRILEQTEIDNLRDGTCRVNTKGIIKQTVVHSSLCGHYGKQSGQCQLTQLHSNTSVHIIHSVKTSLPWYSSLESWTRSTHFVIPWQGWLVWCRWNDPGFPVVTVTEVEAGRWKPCRYPSIPLRLMYCSYYIWISLPFLNGIGR